MGALPAEVNTMSPVPSSSSQCLSPSCPSGLFVVLMPWRSTGAVYTQSQVLGQIRPNASLHVLADPFHPQTAPHQRKGCRYCTGGRPESLCSPTWAGQCRHKCPVKCSITPVHEAPRGLGQPEALPRLGGTMRAALGSQGCREAPAVPRQRTVPPVLRGDEGHLASSHGEGGAVPSVEHTVQQLLLLPASLIQQLCLLLQRPAGGLELLGELPAGREGTGCRNRRAKCPPAPLLPAKPPVAPQAARCSRTVTCPRIGDATRVPGAGPALTLP